MNTHVVAAALVEFAEQCRASGLYPVGWGAATLVPGLWLHGGWNHTAGLRFRLAWLGIDRDERMLGRWEQSAADALAGMDEFLEWVGER